MRNVIIAILWVLITTNSSTAQTSKNNYRHSVGMEIGKLGFVYNIIYDYRFKNLNMGLRANAGRNMNKYLEVYQAGGGCYYLFGKKNDHLELGVDINYFNSSEISDDQRTSLTLFPVRTASTIYSSGNLGYRSYSKKTVFRVGVSQGYLVRNYYTGGYISFGITI